MKVKMCFFVFCFLFFRYTRDCNCGNIIIYLFAMMRAAKGSPFCMIEGHRLSVSTVSRQVEIQYEFLSFLGFLG